MEPKPFYNDNVRRIDDLGRIVIPKHIRKALNPVVFPGDPFEIYIQDGEIRLRPLILAEQKEIGK